jgi:hypothetical protein
MSSPISGITQAQGVPQTDATPPKPTTAAAKTPQTATDTVKISSAAVQTAAQEISETPAQTVREAAKGDNQAKRLLAREQAATQVTQK